jgi:hypothetical protein
MNCTTTTSIKVVVIIRPPVLEAEATNPDPHRGGTGRRGSRSDICHVISASCGQSFNVFAPVIKTLYSTHSLYML